MYTLRRKFFVIQNNLFVRDWQCCFFSFNSLLFAVRCLHGFLNSWLCFIFKSTFYIAPRTESKVQTHPKGKIPNSVRNIKAREKLVGAAETGGTRRANKHAREVESPRRDGLYSSKLQEILKKSAWKCCLLFYHSCHFVLWLTMFRVNRHHWGNQRGSYLAGSWAKSMAESPVEVGSVCTTEVPCIVWEWRRVRELLYF